MIILTYPPGQTLSVTAGCGWALLKAAFSLTRRVKLGRESSAAMALCRYDDSAYRRLLEGSDATMVQL